MTAMNKYTGYSSRASLGIVAKWIEKQKVWEKIETELKIKQKTIKHTPHDKLRDVFINMLAGGQGISEINVRVRGDQGLQKAFGRKTCAEQSLVSSTLNACSEKNVEEMRKILREIYQEFGQGYRHHYKKAYLLLDIDLTGLLAGKQAEGASKGYFSGTKNKRGRQLGRVWSSQYEEIVCEQLYDGKVQLEKCLTKLIESSESVLGLEEKQRKRTILRVDGGGGTDSNINWALKRGYFWFSKVKNWQRTQKLVKPITAWQTLPHLPKHQVAWVSAPHSYYRPTRQLAVRWQKPKGGWHYCVLVFNLTNQMIFELAKQTLPTTLSETDLFSAIMKAYNLRCGAVETSFKNSKQGLGIHKRNKKNFQAQHILVLLAQLAYNILIWVRQQLAKHKPSLRSFGILRLLRDVFSISGSFHFDEHDRLIFLALNPAHRFASLFLSLPRSPNDLYVILHEI
jgi:hypothetical protein